MFKGCRDRLFVSSSLWNLTKSNAEIHIDVNPSWSRLLNQRALWMMPTVLLLLSSSLCSSSLPLAATDLINDTSVNNLAAADSSRRRFLFSFMNKPKDQQWNIFFFLLSYLFIEQTFSFFFHICQTAAGSFRSDLDDNHFQVLITNFKNKENPDFKCVSAAS